VPAGAPAAGLPRPLHWVVTPPRLSLCPPPAAAAPLGCYPSPPFPPPGVPTSSPAHHRFTIINIFILKARDLACFTSQSAVFPVCHLIDISDQLGVDRVG
jgi:hypothetical protein